LKIQSSSVRSPVVVVVAVVLFVFRLALVVVQVSPQSPRYLVIPQPSMSVLRIDSAKAGKDDAKYECVAENGVGDAVVASATLSIYPGK
jgi:hypothetical protein